MDSCEYLSDKACCPLDRPCLFLGKPQNCGFRAHYVCLDTTGDPLITAEIKEILTPKVVKNWKKYRGSGGRQMTARPLEDSVSEVLKSKLGHIGVEVKTRKKLEISPGVKTIMDITVEEPGYPSTLISMKTWIGAGEFRNCFGNAYFIKMMYGMIKTRFYIVTLLPVQMSTELVKLAKPYIDGLYGLAEEPYIDELFESLEELYNDKDRMGLSKNSSV